MLSKFFKWVGGTILGLVLGISFSYVTFAHAAVGAVFDTINRAYFVATSNYPMTLGTAGTGAFTLVAANTPVAVVSSTGITLAAGMGVGMPVYVPTMAATPAAGTNNIKKGFNAIPTAAASTAACLPAVPVAGDVFEGTNNSGAAVRIKACGTPGINGAAAGTYFPVAIAAYFKCVATTATRYDCGTLAIPTPAGP